MCSVTRIHSRHLSRLAMNCGEIEYEYKYVPKVTRQAFASDGLSARSYPQEKEVIDYERLAAKIR